ncbi:MAG: response regulator [Alphaproteobacteria bacterium]
MSGVDASKQRLLIVDDDEDLSLLIKTYLQAEQYIVRTAADARAARTLLKGTPFDLVIVDLRLPGESGLDLARWLQAQSDAGVIILTARGDATDRIVGLESGADDYLVKPVDLRELLARVRSVLRRRRPAERAPPAKPAELLRFGPWQLDLAGRRLMHESGTEMSLTGAEFDLLRVLVERPNQSLSRDRLLDLTRGRDVGPFDRSIDVLVSRLRRKIEQNPDEPAYIRTLHGVGYMFTAPVQSGPKRRVSGRLAQSGRDR